MRKIYKSALVIAAMALATAASAQTVGTTYSGITGTVYVSGDKPTVKITTDYPKANYVVKNAAGENIGEYIDNGKAKAGLAAKEVIVTLTKALAVGETYTVSTFAKTTGTAPTSSYQGVSIGDIKGIAGAYAYALGNVVSVSGVDAVKTIAYNLESGAKFEAAGSSVVVSGKGIFHVYAEINGSLVVIGDVAVID